MTTITFLRSFYALSAILILTQSDLHAQQVTKNRFVQAMVSQGTGCVTVKRLREPGQPRDTGLTFQGKTSFLSVMKDRKVYTNNDSIEMSSLYGGSLANGVLTKVDDTVRCVWGFSDGE